MADFLQIKTLGGLSIQRNGKLVGDFASRKAEVLLVYLACNPRIHQREALADLLWDDRSQRRALSNLRVVLSSLRKVVGPFVTITRDTASINPDANVWLDAVELEEGLAQEITTDTAKPVAEALDLYRGDFLKGVHVRGARGLEEWMVRQRERLHRLAVDGGQRLVNHYLEMGRYRKGRVHATRLLEIDPLLEPGHRQLMELLARDGQRAAALAQYERCRQLLSEELGVEPATDTMALYQAVRDDALPDRPLSPPLAPSAVPDVVSLPPLLSGEEASTEETGIFVAREPELAWLGSHLDAALAGNGRLLFVTGEAGMGKTALLHEFARLAGDNHAQLLTAVGRGSALTGTGDPYLPFRQLLGQLTGDVEAALAAGHLTAAQATRLWQGLANSVAVLLEHGSSLINHLLSGPALLVRAERATADPVWLEPLRSLTRQEALPLAEATDLQQQLTAVFQALAEERPLLLLLDDVQWADSASLGLLFHLCHHLAGHYILIAAAYRSEAVTTTANDRPHPLLQVVNEARRRFGDVELELAPVIRRQGRAFVDQLLDTEPNRLGEPFRQQMFQRTGGHPLFTVELLRAMQGRGDLVQDAKGFWVAGESLNWAQLPAQVEGVIAERVGRLPPELHHLLEVASVEGETFTAQVLAQVTDADERQVLRQLSGKLDRRYRLVRTDGRQEADGRRLARYRFRHALFRQYLYAQLDEVERAYLHEDVGLALESLYGENTAVIAPRLAHHFRRADVADKAINYALQAGDAARTLYAHTEAVDHYRHALSLLRAGDHYDQAARTQMKLGLTHHQAFRYRQAQRAYEEAFRLWQHAPAIESQSLPPAPHPLRLATREPLMLDPAHAGDAFSGNAITQLFAGLVEETETLEIVPDMATSWQIQDGGRTYVFHLRPDARWSDGTPVTAYDFEFAWKRVLSPATQSPCASLFYDIRGARAYHQGELTDADKIGVGARDAHTFVVELNHPTAYFLSLAASWAARIVPRHVVTATGDRWTDPANIVTSGPFHLESWQPRQQMKLVRNRHYYRPLRGNIERVSLCFQHGEEQERLYESDDLDVLEVAYNDYSNQADLVRFLQRNTNDLLSLARLHTSTLTFNLQQLPFSDVLVRRAFAMSIDLESSAGVGGWFYAVPAAGGYVPPGMPGHTPDAGLPFDPVQARQLLAEAGFPGGKGFPAVTLICPEWSASARECRWFADQWQRNLGVSVEWQLIPFSEYRRYVREQQPSLRLEAWEADYPDPDNFLRVALDRFQPTWRDEQYLRLVEQARKLTDQDERLALYRLADRILIENACMAPLVHNRLLLLRKPWVKLFPASPMRRSLLKDVVIVPH